MQARLADPQLTRSLPHRFTGPDQCNRPSTKLGRISLRHDRQPPRRAVDSTNPSPPSGGNAICNSGIAANSPGFCEWSYTVGNEEADGWDALWVAVEAVSVAFPEVKGAKGAKAANEAVDLGRALDMALSGKLAGSGPVAGVLEASGRVKSLAALRNYNPKGAIEYVFDPASGAFAVGKPKAGAGLKGSPHEQLAQSIGADPSTVVGGMLKRRSDGTFVADEMSGHFWQNWNPAVRKQFLDTMSGYGLNVIH